MGIKEIIAKKQAKVLQKMVYDMAYNGYKFGYEEAEKDKPMKSHKEFEEHLKQLKQKAEKK